MADTHELAVSRALADAFFEIVPRTYETYCSLASRITLEVFRQMAIPANLVPCQLWHLTPDSNYVIGFVGQQDGEPKATGRWDGHVVCMTQTVLVDAAISSFRRNFDCPVPAVVLAAKLTTPSQVIARHHLGDGRRLWWLNAPYGFDTTPPLEPVEMIADYAAQLVARMRRQVGRTVVGPASAIPAQRPAAA